MDTLMMILNNCIDWEAVYFGTVVLALYGLCKCIEENVLINDKK